MVDLKVELLAFQRGQLSAVPKAYQMAYQMVATLDNQRVGDLVAHSEK